MDQYVHGYGAAEAQRLEDQARTLEELLHGDTRFPDDATVLEAGCGTGAQTVYLAPRSPKARFLGVDRSAASLDAARVRIERAGIANASFEQADLLALPHAAGSFGHGVVTFVLEHLPAPVAALRELRRVLRPGGRLIVVEGDHGSALFHPRSQAAEAAIACLVLLQSRAGGDARIGRRLRPLLEEAGFGSVRITPRLVFADAADTRIAGGFVRRTFTPMVAQVRAAAIEAKITTGPAFDQGVADLLRCAEAGGMFLYCFFRAEAVVPD